MSNPNNIIYNITDVPEPGKYCPLGQNVPTVQFGNLVPTNDQNSKIIFIGDAYVGKTTLIGCMKTSTYLKDYYATVGCAFVPIECRINSHQIKLNIWDTAGAEIHDSMTKAYYRGSNFACVCFAYNEPKSFSNIAKWMDALKENAGLDLNGVFLIGCKADLEHKVTDQQIQSICQKYKLEFFETSSLKKYNVTNFVKRLCYIGVLMAQDKSHAKKVVISDTVDLTQEQPAAQKDEKCKC